MGKNKGCDCEPGLPGWMATFSDMMTLLLTFFVLLLSMSSLDQQKLKEALGSLRGALGVLEGGTKTDVNVRELIPSLEIVDVPPRRLADKTYQKVRLQIYRGRLKGKVEADRTEEGVVLRVDSSLLFRPGDATVGPKAAEVLHEVAELLRGDKAQVRIEGHTDSLPIRSERYPSNWELSTARAVNVLRYFVEVEKMDPTRFSAVGYGSTRPIASNATPEGRARNRRVALVLRYPDAAEARRSLPARAAPASRRRGGLHFSINLRKELREQKEKSRGR